MQLIVDANILIAAFLKSATTRELLLDEELELFAPEYFTMEVSRTVKEAESLRKYIVLPEAEIEEFLSFLLAPIKIFPEKEYASFIKKAAEEVPIDDAPYLALSLALKTPIWSNYSAFRKQSLTKVYTTSDLMKILRP